MPRGACKWYRIVSAYHMSMYASMLNTECSAWHRKNGGTHMILQYSIPTVKIERLATMARPRSHITSCLDRRFMPCFFFENGEKVASSVKSQRWSFLPKAGLHSVSRARKKLAISLLIGLRKRLCNDRENFCTEKVENLATSVLYDYRSLRLLSFDGIRPCRCRYAGRSGVSVWRQ